jgi:hypothetical protein
MLECPKCKNWFRDKWNLTSHLSRKKPCNPNFVEIPDDIPEKVKQNNALDQQNNAFDKQNNAFDKQNNAFENPNKCQICLNTFFNKENKKRHEKTCKHRNETRLLEIELGINPDLPQSKTCCRFCNKSMFRIDGLTKHIPICKERQVYHEQLIKEKEKEIQTAQIIINGNNNTAINGNVTNNNIIVFGNDRSMDNIKVEKIIQFLRDLKQHHLPEQTYEKAGDLIVMMENYIQENEANKNFVIPDYKSVIGYIKNEKDWTVTGVENPLNQQFKETAGIIYDKKEEIDNVNEKVFQSNTNCEIFNHVKQFNNKGFGHGMYGEQKIKTIKSNYKITKLKNQNVDDF